MTNTIDKKRIIGFDVLRVIACLMVLLIHSPIPSEMANGIFLSTVSYLSAPCIGLFFMISGALLLPIKDTSTFLKKRFTKIVYPTLFWSLFYIGMSFVGKEFEIGLFLKECLSIPFSPQGNGVLWFMYTMMGLYLVTPIISRWLEHSSQKEVKFYLFIWCVTLCYPLLSPYLYLTEDNTGVLYYFTGYLGYYVLGYYMLRYPDDFSCKWVLIACFIALVAPVLCKLFQWKVDFYTVFWYLSVFVVFLCVGWSKLIQTSLKTIENQIIRKLIIHFSNLSLGVYLVHIFIMRTILWHVPWILSIDSYVLQTVIVLVLTAIISLIVCHLLSYLPYSAYIIGYHRK